MRTTAIKIIHIVDSCCASHLGRAEDAISASVSLVLPGRLPAILRRSYNPYDAFGRIAGFELVTGPGWTLSIDVVLLREPSGTRRVILPGNSRYGFVAQPNGSFVNSTYSDFAGQC